MLTTRPHPRSYMPGRAALVRMNGEVSMISMIRRHCASGNSVIEDTCWIPALLTRMSTRPSAATVSVTSQRDASGSERSAALKRAPGISAAAA